MGGGMNGAGSSNKNKRKKAKTKAAPLKANGAARGRLVPLDRVRPSGILHLSRMSCTNAIGFYGVGDSRHGRLIAFHRAARCSFGDLALAVACAWCHALKNKSSHVMPPANVNNRCTQRSGSTALAFSRDSIPLVSLTHTERTIA
jgi:hypothetical protein